MVYKKIKSFAIRSIPKKVSHDGLAAVPFDAGCRYKPLLPGEVLLTKSQIANLV